MLLEAQQVCYPPHPLCDHPFSCWFLGVLSIDPFWGHIPGCTMWAGHKQLVNSLH